MIKTIFCKQTIAHFLKHKRVLFNEKRKMLEQQIYNASLDWTLFKEKLHCKKLCFIYNMIQPDDIMRRCKILSKIIGKLGSTFLIEQPFYCDYGYNITIGDNFCANHNLIILDAGKVTFGDNVLVGPNCGFYTIIHPLDAQMRASGLQQAKPITISNNVWICGNVTVLGGVTIGENSVIGAGSVVTKDIPPNSLAVGSPCKIIKTFSFKQN